MAGGSGSGKETESRPGWEGGRRGRGRNNGHNNNRDNNGNNSDGHPSGLSLMRNPNNTCFLNCTLFILREAEVRLFHIYRW